MRVLVVAPHLDDEILGVGGCIARACRMGHIVSVAVVTRGTEDIFPEGIEVVRREAKEAHALLGINETLYMDFPAAKLDTVPQYLLNQAMCKIFHKFNPDVVLLPFRGDIHKDHQIVFDSAMVCARPNRKGYPKSVYCYETLSETNWSDNKTSPQFRPDVFIDISDFIEEKILSLSCYQSQLRNFPNERSIDAVRALATMRGATVNLRAAEALSLVRMVF